MADSKVTDFSAATSVNSADVLYLIQNETDKKISISTLLANLPNTLTKLSGLFVFGLSNPQTLTNAGTITTTSTLTLISNDGGSHNLILNDGTHPGQIKIVMCTAAGGTSSITTNIKTNVAFTTPGDTAFLMWYGTDWWVLGGTANFS